MPKDRKEKPESDEKENKNKDTPKRPPIVRRNSEDAAKISELTIEVEQLKKDKVYWKKETEKLTGQLDELYKSRQKDIDVNTVPLKETISRLRNELEEERKKKSSSKASKKDESNNELTEQKKKVWKT